MLNQIFKSAIVCSSFVFAFGCANHMTKKTEVKTEKMEHEVTAAADLNRSVVSVVAFSPGKQGLTAQASSEIQKALAEARRLGEIKSVDVAVWSDMEYPAEGSKLPQREIKLADERAKSIEKYVDGQAPSADVNTYNMAKQPNSFQKWLDTRDAEVKNKLVAAQVVNPNGAMSAQGRSSSALIFIEVK